MSIAALALAAFLAGFFGSTHCLGMCGAIVVLFEAQLPADGRAAAWARRSLYNIGRLGFYMVLGAVAGAGGALLTAAAGLGFGLLLLRLLAALLVIAIGLNLLMDWRFTDFLERGGARLWQKLSPLARHVLPVTTPTRAFGAGLLWGALPCGLVYSAVAIAATSSSAFYGAMIMLAFWLGTLPALLLAGASAERIAGWKSRRALRRVAGALLLIVGILALIPLTGDRTQHSHASTGHGTVSLRCAGPSPAGRQNKPHNHAAGSSVALRQLFSDAEAAKYSTQEIITRELTGYFSQCLLRQAQLFGKQFPGPRLQQLPFAFLQVCARPCQRLQVSAAGAERSGIRAFKPHNALQVGA